MQQRIDSLAQQVEHNTFNVGVLGSSPRRITKRTKPNGDKKETSPTILTYCRTFFIVSVLLERQKRAQFENLGELVKNTIFVA